MLLFFDKKRRTVGHSGNYIELTKKEYLLLSFMVRQNEYTHIPIEKIISEVWEGRENTICGNNIAQLCYRVRQKLLKIDVGIKLTVSQVHGGRIDSAERIRPVFESRKNILYYLFEIIIKTIAKKAI